MISRSILPLLLALALLPACHSGSSSGSDDDTDSGTDSDTDTDSDSDSDTDTDTDADTGPSECYGGDYEITSIDDVAGIEPYPCITGDLVIECSLLESLSLPNLESVYKSLVFSFNTHLTDIDLPLLEEVGSGPEGGGLFFTQHHELTTLDGFDSLVSVGGTVELWINQGLVNASFPSLAAIHASLEVEDNWQLESVALPALEHLGHDLLLADNQELTTVGLGSLSTVPGGLIVRSETALIDMDGMSGITSVGQLVIEDNDNLSNIDGLDNLTEVVSTETYCLYVNHNPSLPDCEVCELIAQIDSLPDLDVINFDLNLVDECTPVPDNCP